MIPAGRLPVTRGGWLPRGGRRLAAVAGAALTLGLVAGCAGAPSPEESYCGAGEDLRADVAALGDINIIAQGTDALDEALTEIRSDLDALKESGSTVAAEEIATLETAVADLGTSFETLGSSISVSAARDVGAAVKDVVDSAGALLDVLATTCP
jgi:hypothetical protein